MKSEISFVRKMNDFIFSEEYKEDIVMALCGKYVLYGHTKCVFHSVLAFPTHLALLYIEEQ